MSTRAYSTIPRIGVGAFVLKEGRVLLVKRAASPGKGLWAIPGGMIELGETLQEAAEREVLEETGIIIQAGEPVFVFDLIDKDETGSIRYHYVIVDVLADYVRGEPEGRDDASDARFFLPRELNDLEISPTTRKLLKKLKFIR